MPTAPPGPCRHPGCPLLTTDRYCPDHRGSRDEADRQARGSARKRGYDRTWDKLSLLVRQEHPQCQRCIARGVAIPPPSTEVHHIVAVEEAPELRLVRQNLLAVCHACHAELERAWPAVRVAVLQASEEARPWLVLAS